MSQDADFNFGDDAVAQAYDAVIAPTLFHAWTNRLVEQHGPWEGRRVLDIATGTGIVAQYIGERVGPEGSVVGADLNPQMLSMARLRCADLADTVTFVESSADSLDVANDAVDVVVCQQGFQFFPDRDAAAREMHRVLRPGGKLVVSTWLPVAECSAFGVLCEAFEAIDAPDISASMRVPFDNMPTDELVGHFETAGFDNVRVQQHEEDMPLERGIEQAIEVAYATPVAALLRTLPEDRQARFRDILIERVTERSNGAATMGRNVSNLLTAQKAA